MADIKEVILQSNPWWKEKFEPHFKPREVYAQIKNFLKLPQIIALTGLRRVGKTTIMYKIIEDSIKGGFDPKNIVYFSFDEFRDIRIKEVLDRYEELLEKNLREGKYIFLFDEIQKVNNWEEQIKRIYDLFKDKVKIIISGPESLFIKKKSKETLAGRMFEFKVERLSFKEFLGFKDISYKPVSIYEKELKKAFSEFVLTLGFPELVGVKEKEVIKKYVKESIVDRVVYKDIPFLFKIKDISVLESLLNIFCEEPGNLLEITELSKELKISRQTLANYLNYLESSFLLKKLYNFARSMRKVERKLKKYYPGTISVDLLFRDDNLSKSRVFEWVIVDQLKAEFFWRDPYKNEVDIIIPEKEPIPIEIKYGKISFDGILAFMKKFKVKRGYIVSDDKEGMHKIDGKIIEIVPAFKFLLGERPKLVG